MRNGWTGNQPITSIKLGKSSRKKLFIFKSVAGPVQTKPQALSTIDEWNDDLLKTSSIKFHQTKICLPVFYPPNRIPSICVSPERHLQKLKAITASSFESAATDKSKKKLHRWAFSHAHPSTWPERHLRQRRPSGRAQNKCLSHEINHHDTKKNYLHKFMNKNRREKDWPYLHKRTNDIT